MNAIMTNKRIVMTTIHSEEEKNESNIFTTLSQQIEWRVILLANRLFRGKQAVFEYVWKWMEWGVSCLIDP